MFRISKRCKTSYWRLTTYINSFNVDCMLGGIEDLHQAKALIQKRTIVTGRSLKLPLVSLSRRPPILMVGKRVVGEETRSQAAMSKAFSQISRSPFTRCIERPKLPHHFAQPTFTIYNGRTNLVEHASHFNQRIAIHSRNEVLMCKVFPSSLKPIAMRWFDGLEEGLISSS